MRRGPSPVHAGNRGGKDSQRSTQEHTTPESKHACCSTKALALRHGGPRGWLNQMTRAGATQVLDRRHRIRGHPPRRRAEDQGCKLHQGRTHCITSSCCQTAASPAQAQGALQSSCAISSDWVVSECAKKGRTHASPEND